MMDPLIRGVLSMMRQFGGMATMVVDTGESTYDPETSTSTPLITSYPVRLIAQDYIQKTSGITTASGGLVQTGDKQFFIQVDDGIPLPRAGVDYIIFQGRKWTAIAIKDYNPSGSKSYLYEVYARA